MSELQQRRSITNPYPKPGTIPDTLVRKWREYIFTASGTYQIIHADMTTPEASAAIDAFVTKTLEGTFAAYILAGHTFEQAKDAFQKAGARNLREHRETNRPPWCATWEDFHRWRTSHGMPGETLIDNLLGNDRTKWQSKAECELQLTAGIANQEKPVNTPEVTDIDSTSPDELTAAGILPKSTPPVENAPHWVKTCNREFWPMARGMVELTTGETAPDAQRTRVHQWLEVTESVEEYKGTLGEAVYELLRKSLKHILGQDVTIKTIYKAVGGDPKQQMSEGLAPSAIILRAKVWQTDNANEQPAKITSPANATGEQVSDNPIATENVVAGKSDGKTNEASPAISEVKPTAAMEPDTVIETTTFVDNTTGEILAFDPNRAIKAVKGGSDLISAMMRDQVLIRSSKDKDGNETDGDYGNIAGSKKPGLFKSGAEKLCSAFGLRPIFKMLPTSISDWDKPLFYFHYRCELYRISTGELVATANGSCNSREDKYGWRWVELDKVPRKLRAELDELETRPNKIRAFKFAINEAKTDGPYGKTLEYWKAFHDAIESGKAQPITMKTRAGDEKPGWEMDGTTYRVPNNDVFSIVNTLDKMAQKRSLVAAVLIGTAASLFFTQDVEDLPNFGLVDAA